MLYGPGPSLVLGECTLHHCGTWQIWGRLIAGQGWYFYRWIQTSKMDTDFSDSKVMGPTWGRQGPGGLHVGPMNLAIWVPTGRKADSPILMYRDDILRPIVRSEAGAIDPKFLLMQDSAWSHTVRVSKQTLHDEGTDVLEWTSHSHDLASLNYAWDIKDRCLRRRPHQPHSFDFTSVTIQPTC